MEGHGLDVEHLQLVASPQTKYQQFLYSNQQIKVRVSLIFQVGSACMTNMNDMTDMNPQGRVYILRHIRLHFILHIMHIDFGVAMLHIV